MTPCRPTGWKGPSGWLDNCQGWVWKSFKKKSNVLESKLSYIFPLQCHQYLNIDSTENLHRSEDWKQCTDLYSSISVIYLFHPVFRNMHVIVIRQILNIRLDPELFITLCETLQWTLFTSFSFSLCFLANILLIFVPCYRAGILP